MGYRYRLTPTPEQERVLLEHCSHARYMWNLAWNLYQFGTLETYGRASRRKDRNGNEYTHQKRRPVRPLPRFAEQCRMLTEARAEYEWLAAGSVIVQQAALRDFSQAMQNFYAGTHGRPQRRKRDLNEGFRVTGDRGGWGGRWDVRRLSRRVGEVYVPKLGWVRFRWSRAVPDDAKSYRVTLDRSGRWHVGFTGSPKVIEGPGTGEVVGIDRGVVVSAALSTGELLHAPRPSARERKKQRHLEHKMARAKRGSNRRVRVRLAAARLRARDKDRRKDWAEKLSTDIARRFDVIRVEDLKVANMTRSARGTAEEPGRNVRRKTAVNRGIMQSGWGLLVRRLEEKAPARVEKIKPAYTSQRCSACGHVDGKSRESQARFVCTACGFTLNADVNAAINIAAGHAVTARGGSRLEPVNREPKAA
jgi:putative transposase